VIAKAKKDGCMCCTPLESQQRFKPARPAMEVP